jgi:1-aminocyclopropane-1-carboxylate deaminase
MPRGFRHGRGIVSDPVYEGKSMAALIDLVRDGTIPKESNVLFG